VRALQKRPPSFYVALAAALALGAAFAYAESRAAGWDAGWAHFSTRATGWCAIGALVLALAATPLARAFRPQRAVLTKARRSFGIAAALLATIHALAALRGPLDGAWDAIATWPYLRAGLVALLILLALLATSFPRSIRLLRVRVWKPLHRLAYAAAALALLHVYLGPFAPRRAVATVFVLLVALLVARLIPRLRRPSTRR